VSYHLVDHTRPEEHELATDVVLGQPISLPYDVAVGQKLRATALGVDAASRRCSMRWAAAAAARVGPTRRNTRSTVFARV